MTFRKNVLLKAERNVGFEDVLLAIVMVNVLDDLTHHNAEKYPNQAIFIILIDIKNYVYIVPHVEDDTTIYLKQTSTTYTPELGSLPNEFPIFIQKWTFPR